jgi:hypothetical protein
MVASVEPFFLVGPARRHPLVAVVAVAVAREPVPMETRAEAALLTMEQLL